MTDTDYKWEKYEHTWLGCPDLPIDKDNDIYTSKIGGKPVFSALMFNLLSLSGLVDQRTSKSTTYTTIEY